MTRQDVIDNNMPSTIIFVLVQLGFSERIDKEHVNVSLDNLTDDNAQKIQDWIDNNVSMDDYD